ncbi:hypothetical protein CR513_14925, partial [Mucuna pruriens]
MHGLNRDMQDVVYPHDYGSLGELVQQVVKLKRRSALRRSTASTSGWKGRDREEKVRSNRSPMKGSDPFQGPKELYVTPSAPRTSSIKCFKSLVKGHIAS